MGSGGAPFKKTLPTKPVRWAHTLAIREVASNASCVKEITAEGFTTKFSKGQRRGNKNGPSRGTPPRKAVFRKKENKIFLDGGGPTTILLGKRKLHLTERGNKIVDNVLEKKLSVDDVHR